MAVVLVTGMSGAGKSAVLAELARRGHAVVDTDEGGCCEEVTLPDGRVEQQWREARIVELLDAHPDGVLFVSGTVPNQGRFYPRFDAVVLLSAPLDVLLERVRSRTTNPYGKSDVHQAFIAADVAVVEPLLRAGATDEIDTRRPLAEVADELERIAARESPGV
jgi:dephospho-CoA kinase